MKIKILGTRGEIEEKAPWHTKHSGVLVDDHFLLDLGEEEYLNYKPSFIVFSHFHPDHAYFVRRKKELSEKIKAYGPEAYGDIRNVIVANEPFHVDHYKFIPIPTIHSLKVKSQSYIIEHEDKRLLYTGDLAWMEKKYQKQLGHLDMVITEGSFFRKGGMIRRDKKSGKIFGHTGVPDLIRIFSNHTDHIVLMHFGKWFMKDVEASRKKIEKEAPGGVKVEAARDGQEFYV
ncbi:MAG: MBL fold metallo-hydrolase [Bacteroidota bacterium]